MQLRNPNDKLKMSNPPKTEFDKLKESIEKVDKKLDKITTLLKTKMDVFAVGCATTVDINKNKGE